MPTLLFAPILSRLCAGATLWLFLLAPASAAETGESVETDKTAETAEAAKADKTGKTDKEAAAPATVWEGAIGLTTSYRPEYSGSANHAARLSPGFFLRYGRLTITNTSGFVTRRADDVVRGLALDLLSSERVRLNLALRYDAGRSESSSDDLKGIGNIKPTVRVRLSASWRLEGPWRLGASWSVDAFGRGGGNNGDISAGWEQRVSPSTVLNAGVSLGLAADRYMQTYYGVNAEQSARSGYPVYEPGNGVRDLSAGLNMRHDLGERWIVLAGANVSRLLGPAAASPLTRNPNGWSVSAGLAWRF